MAKIEATWLSLGGRGGLEPTNGPGINIVRPHVFALDTTSTCIRGNAASSLQCHRQVPTLLYNCETWGLTEAALEKLNAFHRRQLRNLFGIRYPAIISNKDLYSRAHTQPLSHTVAVRRFQMLGHVLRMPSDAPPQQAMDNYFRRDFTGVRGRPKSNLATAVMASAAAGRHATEDHD